LMRQSCRSRVEMLFSDVAVTKSYLSVYMEMLNASKRIQNEECAT
jgi:hypothetical protein